MFRLRRTTVALVECGNLYLRMSARRLTDRLSLGLVAMLYAGGVGALGAVAVFVLSHLAGSVVAELPPPFDSSSSSRVARYSPPPWTGDWSGDVSVSSVNSGLASEQPDASAREGVPLADPFGVALGAMANQSETDTEIATGVSEATRRSDASTGGTAAVATYRTVCVRLCDGAYFPVSFATTRDRFADDEQVCNSSCSSSARLFAHPNPGGRPEAMVDRQGKPYAELANAFRFRSVFDAACSCNGGSRDIMARGGTGNVTPISLVAVSAIPELVAAEPAPAEIVDAVTLPETARSVTVADHDVAVPADAPPAAAAPAQVVAALGDPVSSPTSAKAFSGYAAATPPVIIDAREALTAPPNPAVVEEKKDEATLLARRKKSAGRTSVAGEARARRAVQSKSGSDTGLVASVLSGLGLITKADTALANPSNKTRGATRFAVGYDIFQQNMLRDR